MGGGRELWKVIGSGQNYFECWMVAIECWKNRLILGKILPIKGSSHLRAWHPKSQRSDPSFGEKLRERNVLKHVVILYEYLTPQYGYYGFALLKDIS